MKLFSLLDWSGNKMADAFKSVEEPAPADPKENVISPKNGNGTKQNPQKKIKFKVGMVISSKTVKYTIRRKIGDSRLGAVYEVFNERDAVFCMKIEYKNPELPDPKLGMEIAILRHMRQTSVSPHFVEYIDRCAKPTYYFMVTSMVGPNLERLLDRRQGKMFSPRTAVAVTLQIVDALRELHQLGYVHRDIRPHNLLIGLKEKSHIMYLINFGSAAIYIKNKKIRKPRNVVPMKGMLTYASLSSHEQQEQSPRDDVESLIYTMYGLCDTLPWADNQKVDDVQTLKKKCRTDEESRKDFHKKMDVKIMSDLIKYLDQLGYFDTVDYEYVKKMIHDSAKAVGINNFKERFEWEDPNTSDANTSKRSTRENDSDEESSLMQPSRRVFDQ